MPNDDLNQAIQFVQQGQHDQAQAILQELLQANPQDLTVWSWYVKSCRTPEKRLEALETCLVFNPGNQQLMEAIQKMREKVAAQEVPGFSPSAAPGSPASNPQPYAYYTGAATPAAVNQIESAGEPAELIGLDESPGRPFMWYEVWLKALTQANADTYTALIRDPLASPGRAYWWVILAGLVTGLFSLISVFVVVNDPSFMETLTELEVETTVIETIGKFVAVGLIVLIPVQAIFSVLGLLLGAAIYSLMAKLFGGTGSFSRTVYLMGAYSAPLSIIIGILSIIPVVQNCLPTLLGLYSFWLSVTSIQVANRLNGGRATIVVLIPSLLILMIVCITAVWLPQALVDAIRQN